MIAVIHNKSAILLHIQCPNHTTLYGRAGMVDLFPGNLRSNGEPCPLGDVKLREAFSVRFSKRWDGGAPAILPTDFRFTWVIVGKRYRVTNPAALHLTTPHNSRQLTDPGPALASVGKSFRRVVRNQSRQ